jgi:hypothetical protein
VFLVSLFYVKHFLHGLDINEASNESTKGI